MKVLTWNVEGISRDVFNLLDLAEAEQSSVIFIAEHWLHLLDAPLTFDEYFHQYSYFLNFEYRHDPLLSLTKSRAHGGTFALWKKELNPFISNLEPLSSHILVLVLDKPGF